MTDHPVPLPDEIAAVRELGDAIELGIAETVRAYQHCIRQAHAAR